MEWTQKYNSFNSYKGLTYYENYLNMVDWLNGADPLFPPVECNLDPMAECNLNCYFCITQRYLKHNRQEVGEMRKLPLEYMIRLVDFLADWGVRGLCLSGGGEPSLHDGLPDLIRHASQKMDVAVVTNAVNLSTDLLLSLMSCRWLALSVDAGDRQTYEAIKGKPVFDRVIKHVKDLAETRYLHQSSVDLCFKFLIVPENQHQIYDACKLAKDLGVQDFHARPVDFERKDIEGGRPLEMNVQAIHYQFDRCHELEDENFHVYTVTHKFDENFHVKYDYSACVAAPILLPILTDGNAYICVEHKMEEKYRLGSAYPDPEKILEWWGSDRHRQMIKDIVPQRDCSRCIYSSYHQQISEVVMKDRMCVSFP